MSQLSNVRKLNPTPEEAMAKCLFPRKRKKLNAREVDRCSKAVALLRKAIETFG